MSKLGLQKAKRMRAIVVAANAAGLSADARHDLQIDLTGKASLKDMSFAEVTLVLDHINRLTGYKGHAGKPKTVDADLQLQKIEALLADLKLPWEYIHSGKNGPSMVRRLTGKDRIEWATAEGKAAVIVALIKRAEKLKAA